MQHAHWTSYYCHSSAHIPTDKHTPPFGNLPQNNAEQIGFWIGGLLSGLCIGGFGILLGAVLVLASER